MAGITDLVTALQNGVTALNSVQKTLAAVFPGATSLSTTAPSSVGSITFTSSEPKGFLSVTTSSGYAGKIAVY